MDLLIRNPFSLVVILVAIWFLRRRWKKRAQRKIVRDLSEKYQHVLAKKRAQLLVEDDYGDLDHDKWFNEAQSFYTGKIAPHLEKKWRTEADAYISGAEVF